MKYLILVRHGECDHNGHLSGIGVKQIESICKNKLKRFVKDGDSVVVLTSTANRTTESARIISSFFNVSYQDCEILWSDNEHSENLAEVLDLVRSQSELDVLILVTHYEYTRDFPTYFVTEELETPMYFGEEGLNKGGAMIIDCQEKDWF